MGEKTYKVSRCDMLGHPLGGFVPGDIMARIFDGRMQPFRDTMDYSEFYDPESGNFFRVERRRAV